MTIVRVKPDVSATVFDANNQTYVTLTVGLEFDSKDPLVKEFDWAFEEDATADRPAKQRRTSVETATADPGSKRNR